MILAKCEGSSGPCAMTGTAVRRAPKMNHYDSDPPMLCPVCMDDYVRHWNDQWAEYYSSQGFPQQVKDEVTATELDILRCRVANFELLIHSPMQENLENGY